MVNVVVYNYDDQYDNEPHTFNISEVALHNACLMCEVDSPDELSLSLLCKIEEMEKLIRKSNPYMAPELTCLRSTQIMALLIMED